MSVSVCDITIPVDFCPPVVLRLAARITQLERELEEWKGKYVSLLSRRPDPVPTPPAISVREFFGKTKIDDLSKYQLDLFLKHRITNEIGSEVCLDNVMKAYHDWIREHQEIPRLYGKHVKQALYDLMKTHFGEPIKNALSPTGEPTVAAVFAGCRVELCEDLE
jgi:hypothetical protein